MSDDRAARLWDTATGEELAAMREPESDEIVAQFVPDGKQIVTLSHSWIARIYVAHMEDLIKFAKMRVTRELTCEERVRYLHDKNVACATSTPLATPALTDQP